LAERVRGLGGELAAGTLDPRDGVTQNQHPDGAVERDDRRVTVRIMIAEDQTIVRQALVALLELESDIEVVAEAGNGDEALAMARKHEPDAVVLDIEMPGPSGIEVASQLTKTGFSGKVVIVTTFDRPGDLRAAMSAGASGFLLKDAAGHDAITDIAGRLHLSPGTVRNHLSAAIQKLGARNRAEAVEIAQRKGWL
jgi:two-component system response regulator DesR